MDSDTQIWTTNRRRGGEICVHTNQDCDRLVNAATVYEFRLDELHDYRHCKRCSGEVEVDSSDPYALRRLLEESDPADIGLSAIGDREQTEVGD